MAILTMTRLVKKNWIVLTTLYTREIYRFFKIYIQTIFAPVITTLVFFIIFSLAIGRLRDNINGIDFMESNAQLNQVNILYSSDKAVSVWENSQVLINDSIFTRSKIELNIFKKFHADDISFELNELSLIFFDSDFIHSKNIARA